MLSYVKERCPNKLILEFYMHYVNYRYTNVIYKVM